MKKLAIVFVVLFTYTNGVSQTCIIGFIQNKTIYIGADSRTHSVGIKNDTTYSSVCKFRSYSNYNWVCVNFMPVENSDLAYKIARTAKSSRELYSKHESLFKRMLTQKLDSTREFQPALYSKLLKDSVVSQIWFFKMENDTPTIVRFIFTLINKSIKDYPNLKVLKEYYQSVDPRKTILVMGGETKEIEPMIFNQRNWGKSYPETINKFILISAQYHPNTVAPPVDIIKISIEGKTWIQRKNGCPI